MHIEQGVPQSHKGIQVRAEATGKAEDRIICNIKVYCLSSLHVVNVQALVLCMQKSHNVLSCTYKRYLAYMQLK